MGARTLQKSDFTEVAISDFLSGSELPVDLFIQLSESKFIQIARAGDRLQIERIVNYEQKKITYLLIRNHDFQKYLGRGLTIAGIIIKNKEIPLAQRQTSLTQIAGGVFKGIEQMGFNQEAFTHSKIIVEATISLCHGKSDLFDLMTLFSKFSPSLYAHSVGVSVVSVMIGNGLNWKGHTIEKLGLGGLLHDIGKKDLPESLLKKTRAFMTNKDVVDYESHCFRALQILRSIADIPDDVVSCAYEHHENSLGLGYPRGIKQVYLNPLSRVVALANEFCKLTMKVSETSTVRTATSPEAIHHIESIMGQPYWPEAFKVLKDLVVISTESKTA